MCSGNRKREEERRAREEQERLQREANERAAARQRELDALAAQRQALADRQAFNLLKLQDEQDEIQRDQQNRIDRFQNEYQAKLDFKTFQNDKAVVAAVLGKKAAEERAEAARLNKIEFDKAAAVSREQAEATRAATVTEVKNTRIDNQAIATSLRILGQQNSQAPTAQQSKKKPQAKGAKTTTASLKFGSQQNSSGANLSI